MGCTPSRPCSSTGASNQRKSSSSVSLTTVVPTVANQGAESSHHVTNSSQSHSVLVKDNNQINAVPSTLHIVTLPSANNQSGDDAKQTNAVKTNDPQNTIRLGSMQTAADPLKLLLVFGREDAQSSAWRWAAAQLPLGKCTVQMVRSVQQPQVQAEVRQSAANLIVIDRRTASRTAEADALCRWIRDQPSGHHPVIVAVVKKSLLEREESSVAQLLSTGYDRFYAESGSLGACLNELLTLQWGELRSRQRLRLAEAAVAACDASRELVTVADGQLNVVYVNGAVERLLGYNSSELLGRSLLQMVRSKDGHLPAINSSAPSGQQTQPAKALDLNEAVHQMMHNATRNGEAKEWEGKCISCRKTGDSVSLFTRFCLTPPPSKSSSDEPWPSDHVILLQEPPPLLIDKSLSADMTHPDFYPLAPRSSIQSARKASYDVRSLGSDGVIRRQSLARLHSMAIEAPITKVINIISAAQESSPIYISQALDKVLEILRSTELYLPSMTETRGRSEDPVTTDLLGALLMQGQKPGGYSRRSSNESALKTSISGAGVLHSKPLLPSLHNISVPIQLREMLENDSQWDFDVIRLEKLTGKRPLVWLGMTIMTRLNVPQTLKCDEATLQNWLTVIEANYHSSNAYHNSTHAADVLQSTAYFLQRQRIKPLLDEVDEAACLIAAAIHDVDHPGKTSGFLCNAGSELAILYNDISVLESHHAALAFKLTLLDERVNIFKGLERATFKELRKSIIDMVLATEMSKHFEHVSKFINLFAKPNPREEDSSTEPVQEIDYLSLSTPENVPVIKRMLIKCADVSNPTRPLNMCIEWARRIAEEYFNQTAEEKARGLDVVMPQFDRLTCSIPKSQIGFTDYFINDMFEAWDAFIDVPELVAHIKRNYQFWKDQDAAGITGLPPEYMIPQTPTDLVRKIEFETLAEAKETQE